MVQPRPLRADAERNRRLILDAARRVFAAHGMDAAVDEVARVAGVGVGTLYRRFPTKDLLVEAILEDRLQAIGPELRAVANAHDEPWERLAAVLHAWAAVVVADRGVVQVISERLTQFPGIAACREEIVRVVEPALHSAQRSGDVRADIGLGDVTTLVFMVAALPEWRLQADPQAWERPLALALDSLRATGANALPACAPEVWRALPATAGRHAGASI